jgi:hypothetical protein
MPLLTLVLAFTNALYRSARRLSRGRPSSQLSDSYIITIITALESPMATQQQIDELITKMQEERERFLTQAAALSDEDASRRPEGQTGEAEWSPKEQLSHLWEMERSYIAWVNAALRENGADLTGVRGAPVAIPLEQAREHSVPELIAALKAEREGTLTFIRSLSPEDFDRTARQPMFGELTVLQWLRSFYRHDRMHNDQIAGRDPEYKPRFLSGKEPDQRRGAMRGA